MFNPRSRARRVICDLGSTIVACWLLVLGCSSRRAGPSSSTEAGETRRPTSELRFEVQRGHVGPFGVIDWSPDGSRWLTIGEDGAVVVWDGETGVEQLVLARTPERLLDPSYRMPYGSTVLQGFDRGTSASTAAWAPDGDVFVGYGDGQVAKWDLASAKIVVSFQVEGSPRRIQTDPEGELVVVQHGALTAWSATSKEALWTSADEVREFALGPDSVLLLTRKHLRRRSIESGDLLVERDLDDTKWIGPLRDGWVTVGKAAVRWLDDELVARHSEALETESQLAVGPNGRGFALSYRSEVALFDTQGRRTRTLSACERCWQPSVRYSPDGKRLVTCGTDAPLQIWDVASGEPVRTFSGIAAPVWSVAVSPDGERLTTVHPSGELVAWRVDDGTVQHRVARWLPAVTSLDFVDRDHLLSAHWDGIASIWNLAEGRLQEQLDGHEKALVRARAAPDDQIATLDSDGTLGMWRMGAPVAGHRMVSTFGVGDDGAIVMADREGRVVRLEPGARRRPARGQTGRHPTAIAVGPAGRVAVARVDGTIRLLGPDAQPEGTLGAETDEPLPWPTVGLDWSPDGRRLASVGTEGVSLWDPAQPSREAPVRVPHDALLTEVAFAPDGDRIAAVGLDGEALMFDVDGTVVRRWTASEEGLLAVAWSVDGERLATGGRDGRIRIWSVDGGPALVEVLRFSDGTWLALDDEGRFDGSGTSALVAFRGHRVVSRDRWTATREQPGLVRDALEGAPLRKIGRVDDGPLPAPTAETEPCPAPEPVAWGLPDGPVPQVAPPAVGRGGVGWIADAAYAYAYGQGGTVVWNVADRVIVRRFEAPVAVAAAFDASGTRLVTSDGSGTLQQWRIDEARPYRTIDVHQSTVTQVAIDASGRLVATADDAGVVAVSCVADGRVLYRFDGHDRGVTDVAFADRGDTLISVPEVGPVRAWNLATGQPRWHLPSDRYDRHSIAVAPATDRVAVFADDATGVLVDARDGAVLRRLGDPVRSWHSDHRAPAVTWSPDGSTVASGASSQTFLWSVADGTPSATVGGRYPPWSLRFTSDGRYLVVAEIGGLFAYDVLERSRRALADHHLVGNRGAIPAPADSRVLIGSDEVRTWDLHDGRDQALPAWGRDRYAFGVSGDARWLAMSVTEGRILIFDLERGEAVNTLRLDMDFVIRFEFSPRGDVVEAIDTRGERVRLRVATGDVLDRVAGPSGPRSRTERQPEQPLLRNRTLAMGPDGGLRFVDVEGTELGRLYAFADGTWAVLGADGDYDLVDGTLGLRWNVDGRSTSVAPQKRRRPGLLAKLAGHR